MSLNISQESVQCLPPDNLLKPRSQGTFCVICNSDYHLEFVPYVLSCGHSFCSRCIEKCDLYFSQRRIISQSESIWKCPLCRQNTYDTPPKNFTLIDLLFPSNSCKIHNSEIISYCCNHDQTLCPFCFYEHKNHDVSLLNGPKVDEILQSKQCLLDKYKVITLNQIENFRALLGVIDEIKETNSHFNEKIRRIVEAKEKMINEINEKSLACINELRILGKLMAIDQLEKSLKINLENLKAHNEKIESMTKLFKNKDVVSQLKCKNMHIEINVNEIAFERSDYYGAQIGEIDEIKSIESGQLVYK